MDVKPSPQVLLGKTQELLSENQNVPGPDHYKIDKAFVLHVVTWVCPWHLK